MPSEETEFRDALAASTGRATVLVADDDSDIRMLLSTVLRREGYRVIEACDGAEMLDHLGGALLFDMKRPDLIVSDHRMPGFVGTGLLAGIRASDWTTPFVLITAHGGPVFEREAKILGADAVFKKPFDVDALLEEIDRLLRRPARPRDEEP